MKLSTRVTKISEYFNKLDQEDLYNIFKEYDIKSQFYKKGEIIVRSGCDYTKSVLLLSGKIHSSITGDNGNEVGINHFKPGDILGALIPFSTSGRISVNIICDSDCSIIWLSKELLLKLSVTQPHFIETLFRSTGDKIIGISLKVNDMKFKKLKDRIYEKLLTLSSGRNEFILPYSKTRLAEEVGGSRPSVSRCISTLINEGQIKVTGRKIFMVI